MSSGRIEAEMEELRSLVDGLVAENDSLRAT